MLDLWMYPPSRSYYAWYGAPESGELGRTDHEIKTALLERLRSGPFAEEYDLDVTVRRAS